MDGVNKKISGLDGVETSSISGADLLALVNQGSTKKVTVSSLAQALYIIMQGKKASGSIGFTTQSGETYVFNGTEQEYNPDEINLAPNGTHKITGFFMNGLETDHSAYITGADATLNTFGASGTRILIQYQLR